MNEYGETISSSPDSFKNPYDILDGYIEKACDKLNYTKLSKSNTSKADNESSILKAEVGLLQNQVCLIS